MMSVDGPVYEKFFVTRRDGAHKQGLKHHGCRYFVLDLTHDPYAAPAVLRYAEACQLTHPVLAQDLRDLVRGERTQEGGD